MTVAQLSAGLEFGWFFDQIESGNAQSILGNQLLELVTKDSALPNNFQELPNQLPKSDLSRGGKI